MHRNRTGWFRRFLRVGARSAVALACAVCTWAFTVNRELIQWVDSPIKPFAIAGFALLTAAVAAYPLWRFRHGPWTKIGFGVLLAFGLGELRQLWLRQTYFARREADRHVAWTSPVTTTDLVVLRYPASLPRLGVSSLRVLHVTDLHVTEALPSDYYRRLLTAIAAEDADMAVFTGDSLSQKGRLAQLEAWLSQLPHFRRGMFGVLGNHEHWAGAAREVTRAFERAGVSMIAGRCVDVPLTDSATVRLCGTEAPWGPALAHDTVASGRHAAPPTLVLSHTPDNIYDLSELGVDAVSSGHTHGGQIRFPLLGALIVPSAYGRRFDLGHFRVNGSHLFVSAGVGADAPPLRLWCRPELLGVEFKPE
jgi:predicted MPP superfamily phosphohydrolase